MKKLRKVLIKILLVVQLFLTSTITMYADEVNNQDKDETLENYQSENQIVEVEEPNDAENIVTENDVNKQKNEENTDTEDTKQTEVPDTSAVENEGRSTDFQTENHIDADILTEVKIFRTDNSEVDQSVADRVANGAPISLKMQFSFTNQSFTNGDYVIVKLSDKIVWEDMSGVFLGGSNTEWEIDSESLELKIMFIASNVESETYVLNLNTSFVTLGHDVSALQEISFGKLPSFNVDFRSENSSSIKKIEIDRLSQSPLNETIVSAIFNNHREINGPADFELTLKDVNNPDFVYNNVANLSVKSVNTAVNGSSVSGSDRILEEGTDYELSVDEQGKLIVSFYGLELQETVRVEIRYKNQHLNSPGVAVEGGSSTRRSSLAYSSTYDNEANLPSIKVDAKVTGNFTEINTSRNRNLMKENTTILVNHEFIASYSDKTVGGRAVFAPNMDKKQFTLRVDQGKIDPSSITVPTGDNLIEVTVVSDQEVGIRIKDSSQGIVVNYEVSSAKFIGELTANLRIGGKDFPSTVNFDEVFKTVNLGELRENSMSWHFNFVSTISNDNKLVDGLYVIKHPEWLKFNVTNLGQGVVVEKIPGGTSFKLFKNSSIAGFGGFFTVNSELPFDESYEYFKDTDIEVELYDEGVLLGKSGVYEIKEMTEDSPLKPVQALLHNTSFETADSFDAGGHSGIYGVLDINVGERNQNSTVIKNTLKSDNPRFKLIHKDEFVVYVINRNPQNGVLTQELISPDSVLYPDIEIDDSDISVTIPTAGLNRRYKVYTKLSRISDYGDRWVITTQSITASIGGNYSNEMNVSRNVNIPKFNSRIFRPLSFGTQAISNKKISSHSLLIQNANKSSVIEDPTVEIQLRGTSFSKFDINSVEVLYKDNASPVSFGDYSMALSEDGMKLTLLFTAGKISEDIAINYDTIATNSGTLFSETTISAPSLVLDQNLKTEFEKSSILSFVEGESTGTIDITSYSVLAVDEAGNNVSDVVFELYRSNGQSTGYKLTTDDNGIATSGEFASGKYVLKLSSVPKGYQLPENYLEGEEINLSLDPKDNNFTTVFKVDHSRITVKDAVIFNTDTWTEELNFVSAVDENGDKLDLSLIDVTNMPILSIPGQYNVKYQYRDEVQEAIVTVLQNKEDLVVKNTTIYVGDSWNKADNFVSAMDKNGHPVNLVYVNINASVDTTSPGSNVVTYSYGEQVKQATITVLENKESLTVKSSTLYTGDVWDAQDNFVSATDRDGLNVDISLVKTDIMVDTQTPGIYTVTYSYGNQTKEAVITVLANEETLTVKDSTIHVGDAWNKADNFISATNNDGELVSETSIIVTGTVDTTVPGTNVVTYSYGDQVKQATITVLENKESLTVKSSTLYTGDAWNAQDNFVSATDKNGMSINISLVEVIDAPNMSQADVYPVTYKYGNQTAEAVVTVKENQETLVVNDSVLYIGSTWLKENNFVSATDRDGLNVDISFVKTDIMVDTQTPGIYTVTYSYGNQTKEAVITVLANEETLTVKDSTIHVGDAWNKADNFISATNKDGEIVNETSINLTGTVDTTVPGTNVITYSYGDQVKQATITVLENKESLTVKSSTLYTGDAWNAQDNFVSATDKNGMSINISLVEVIDAPNMSQADVYPVTYKYGNQTAEAVVTVKENQETLVVNDSVLYIGSTWLKENNFVSATDRDGLNVDISLVKTDIMVDTQTPGIYTVTYSYGNHTKEAVITVLANEETLTVKDSTIHVGDVWNKADNIVIATDKDGEIVNETSINLTGTVDTTVPGTNVITYSYGDQVKQATITVLENKESLTVKSSTLYTGDAWNAQDNVVSATDKNGISVSLSLVVVSGLVDTTKPSVNVITYSYGEQIRTVSVTVLENKESLHVRNSSVYSDEEWTAQINFIEATDKEGNQVGFESIEVTEVSSRKIVDSVKTYIYKYGSQVATATVTTLKNQESLSVIDGEIAVGEQWSPEIYFVKGTDKDGNDIFFEDIKVVGTVDTSKVGKYSISYINGKKEVQSHIEVVEADVITGETEDNHPGSDQGGFGSDLVDDNSNVSQVVLPITGQMVQNNFAAWVMLIAGLILLKLRKKEMKSTKNVVEK